MGQMNMKTRWPRLLQRVKQCPKCRRLVLVTFICDQGCMSANWQAYLMAADNQFGLSQAPVK